MATKKKTQFTARDVHAISLLANIPVTVDEEASLAHGFNTTLAVVDQLFSVDVAGVAPTNQVTGLENAFREDVVDDTRTFTQEQALANAPHTHNGFFVVDQILDQE